ncbi:SDR family NAD(P)-dependent oxidoreductase [Ponticaulis sp.]|uniref:SDR family NAD(P)-dependent oxidoreductase n=1 Tax=Ponticaulis sp. TaxID=2020902 RepID=UPI000B6B3D06|nr:SDR family NAD(P)-dependent oxidoreductase [Ponticaulis sp.]MAI89742.1 2-deoxy-D-gluconate 3-dehydrogenase [Ponticaulis sp.]OUY00757.1 MAG: 2-deoxy-D-gluconate 3-dehydrogenase [Hyphomonadaceae bacterium TMED5]|tara:strand:- start:42160 stop:42945 length:786 start_codon:yes stop_codon:yes gene_type:complete
MAYAPFDLTGKVALITGGNRGIGLGMAEALAASNAHVAIWGRKEAANAEAVDKLKGLGTGEVRAWAVDVAEEDTVVAAMAETNGWMGRLDSVIANAGVGFGAKSFSEMTTEIWRKNMAVNLDGAFWTLREATKHMVERAKNGDPGGSLVGIASMAALEGAARNQAYGATKGGLISMIRAISVEHARYGIRANAILPGWIATDMTSGAQDNDKFVSNVISRVPMKRWGEPADFGGMAVYLTSDASSFHTGDSILIDGGYCIY